MCTLSPFLLHNSVNFFPCFRSRDSHRRNVPPSQYTKETTLFHPFCIPKSAAQFPLAFSPGVVYHDLVYIINKEVHTMDYTQYVNTNIGTIGHLLQATSPSVLSPHGAAVAEPVFRAGMKDRYLSDKIFGFSAGSAVLMPLVHGGKPDYLADASSFDHDFETARPDHYEVLLEDSGIQERHTACHNYGVYEFTYPDAEQAFLAVYVRGCTGWKYEDGLLYVQGVKEFEHPVSTVLKVGAEPEVYEVTLPNGHKPEIAEPATALVVRFDTKTVSVPFAMSALGFDSAKESFLRTVEKMGYEDVLAQCKAAWNSVLGKVRVTGGDEARKRVFYTAVYRATSRMHNYSVDGKYIGFDGQIHEDGGYGYHCDDGIWDTYRGMHPLQLILEPKAHRDTIESYLRMYRESGWLPRFPRLAGNAPCMIGHHTVSILAESLVKGVDFDLELAYEAAYKNATERTMLPWKDGEAEELTRCYHENGYFPGLEEDEEETCDRVHEFENRQSVAVTIEQAYDDWCVAQLAKALGKEEEAAYFLDRSLKYRQLYDASIGFFHPKKIDGEFTKVYNPKFCGGQGGRMYFAENNAYIYNFAAQHDIDGTMALFGGKEAMAEKLDNLYVEQYDGVLKSTFLMQYPDATGLMGQFCMGNEPSFHIPYLYNHCGQAWKTQRKIHELIDLWFTDSPLGICGDEDGGAMSAFLAFSAMGFYPVNPASGDYDLGSPIFDKVEIDLPGGRTFTVSAEGASGKAKYIQAATLNGEALTAPRFSHADMMAGGELKLTMGQRPNKTLFA